MTKLTNAVELIEQLRQHDAGISRSGVSVTIFSEAADRIAALEAEVKRTRCPIKMDDARNLCSAGCCYACVCDRLRAATRTLGAADDREICPSGEGYARAGDEQAEIIA